MKKLGMVDWAFLQLETPKKLAHVAGLWIFQLPKGYRKSFFRELRESLSDWEQVNPPFNFKLKMSLSKLDLPQWIEDEQFDLNQHVHHVRLSKPGTQQQLFEWVEHLHSQMLDRSRPLWEIHYIEGLQGRRFAIYCKIHHALVDGITGLNLMVNTFSHSADARATQTLWHPPDKLSKRPYSQGFVAKVGNACAGLFGQLRSLPELSASLAKLSLQALNLRYSEIPLPFAGPKTLLNVPVSARRCFAGHSLSLSAIKDLSKLAEATVNDVILAICAGALRRYLDGKQALPEQPMVAFMPVSTRLSRSRHAGGNQVAAVMCSLATEQADPLQRFAAIKASANAAKLQFSGQSAATTNNHILLFGSVLMLTQQLGLGGHMTPPANVVISNVPGPAHALYLNGAKLVAQYPLSMLIDGLALNITVTSHADNLDFGLLACRDALPDIAVLADHLGEAFAELQTVLTTSATQNNDRFAQAKKFAENI